MMYVSSVGVYMRLHSLIESHARKTAGAISLRLIQLLSLRTSLIVSHLITATTSIWAAQPVLRPASGAIYARRLFKHSPRDERHANHRDMAEHVVRDREWLANIKAERQTPKTKQKNTSDITYVDWRVPQGIEIGVYYLTNILKHEIKKL